MTSSPWLELSRPRGRVLIYCSGAEKCTAVSATCPSLSPPSPHLQRMSCCHCLSPALNEFEGLSGWKMEKGWGHPNASSLPWPTSLPHLVVDCEPALDLISAARIGLRGS